MQKEPTEKQIVSGIPQGSVLGPFLFNLHTNGVPAVCNESTFARFADDTTVVNASNDNSSPKQMLKKFPTGLLLTNYQIVMTNVKLSISGNPQKKK